MDRSLLSALALLTCLVGCLFEPDSEGVQPSPDFIRSTVPADGAQRVGTPFDLSITFRQPVDASTLRLRLFPEPIGLGPVSTSGRTMSWRGIESPAGSATVTVLVDGSEMPRSHLFSFHVADPAPDSGRIGGKVKVPPGMDAQDDILVFAYPVIDTQLDFTAATLALRPATTVVRAPMTAAGAVYLLYGLQLEGEYHILAIADSSGDASRSPVDDVHGLYRDGIFPGIVVAKGFTGGEAPFPAWRTDADLELVLP